MALALTPPPLPLASDDHGVVRVAGTRVTLDTIIGAYKGGRSAEEMAQDYPTVPKSAIYATIAYYPSAQVDVDAYLRARKEQAEKVRAEVEQWSPSTGLRQRLLERRNASDG
jgi:uncharacterized protein (DUF433 family)